MENVTICTFNVENLFVRYKVFEFLPGDKFKRKVLTPKELEQQGGFLPGQLYKSSFRLFDKEEWRKLTAKAIMGYGDNRGKKFPDIVCLQEVDSMDALRLFNEDYLESEYSSAILLDSHDPRRIDVGILSKLKISGIKTNMYEPYKGTELKQEYLFSRDCLEIDFETTDGKSLTIFVNHLKSNYSDVKDPIKKKLDEEKNNNLRLKQAEKVRDLVRDKFPGNSFKKENFIVLGDFNDAPGSPFLIPLLEEIGMEDVISRLDFKERWTHFWQKENSVSQLDYILLSPRLSKNAMKPYIERRGLSNKVKKFTHLGSKKGEKIPFNFSRFPGVTDRIDASDHCPVFVSLKM